MKEATMVSDNGGENEHRRWSWETYMGCATAFMVSLIGGAVLVFWELKHHRTNTQLWMVPVGLILCLTPAYIWVSFIVSNLCRHREGGGSGGGGAGDGGGSQP